MKSKFPKLTEILSYSGKPAVKPTEKVVNDTDKVVKPEAGGMFGKKFQESVDPDTLQKMEESKKKQEEKRKTSNMFSTIMDNIRK